MDPVGGYSKIVKNLVKKYRDAGFRILALNCMKNGRHEMLNEINRREVFQRYHRLDKFQNKVNLKIIKKIINYKEKL
jgi:alpha-beta hydrolase superfamily lysophospholipase